MATQLISLLGCERNGSAAVEWMIHEAFEVTTAGDVSTIWLKGLIRNENCGCGQPFQACPFWSAVIRDGFGSVSENDARQFDRIFRAARGRLVDAAKLTGRANAAFREVASVLYQSVARLGGGRPIIDSSRVPAFAAAVRQLYSGAFGALHLFRDAGATVHSLTTAENDARDARTSTLHAIDQWSVANWEARQLTKRIAGPSAILSFERFCADSDRHLGRLEETFGLVQRRGEARREWHRLPGNSRNSPNGPDDRWRSQMPIARRLLTRAITGIEQRLLESSADEWLRERSGSATASLSAIAA